MGTEKREHIAILQCAGASVGRNGPDCFGSHVDIRILARRKRESRPSRMYRGLRLHVKTVLEIFMENVEPICDYTQIL